MYIIAIYIYAIYVLYCPTYTNTVGTHGIVLRIYILIEILSFLLNFNFFTTNSAQIKISDIFIRSAYSCDGSVQSSGFAER